MRRREGVVVWRSVWIALTMISGDFGLAEVEGAGLRFVEEAVDGGEGFAGWGGGSSEGAVLGEAAVETPGYEDGLAEFVNVGEVAAVDWHCIYIVGGGGGNLSYKEDLWADLGVGRGPGGPPY